MEGRVPASFGALFLNQLKVALCIRGKGLSQFNILPKEETDALQSVAGGENTIDLTSCFKIFDRLFPSESTVAAIKIYYRKGKEVHTQVSAVLLQSDTTVSQLLSQRGLDPGLVVRTQGVSLHGGTPLEFLQKECMYADGFVHLVTLSN